jgi:hypothetical protein
MKHSFHSTRQQSLPTFASPSAGTLRRETPVRLRFAMQARAAALALGASALLLGCPAEAADTVTTVSGTGTTTTTGIDLSNGANYTPNITPTAATTYDVNFAAGSTYASSTFDANGAALSFGSLDDLNATALTITNGNSPPATLQLNLGSTNATTGAAAADLLYVATGASLSLTNGSAGGLTLLLANTGNIDAAGTGIVNIGTGVTITAATTTSFTGTGTTTVSGNIGNTTGAVKIADTTGTTIFSGTNSYTGATTLTSGTLRLVGAGALSTGSALSLATGTTLQLRADANTTFTPTGITAASSATLTFDVNDVTAGTQNNTLTLGAPLVFSGQANTIATINVTGGNGYTLALGAISGVGNGQNFYLNPTTANVTVASVTFTGNSASLDFTGTGNTTVTGTLAGSATKAFRFVFGSTGVVTLDGAETTASTFSANINSGTVVLNNSSAILSGTAVALGNIAASTSAATLLLGGTDTAGLTGGITMSKAVAAEDTTTGALTIGGQNTSGTNTYSASLTLGATTNTGKSVNLAAATGGEVDFTNTIVKNGTDTLAGITVNSPYTVGTATVTPTGTVKLTAANTFAGATTIGTSTAGAANITSAIANGGTLNAAGNGALGGTTSIVVNNGGTLALSGVTTTGTTAPGGVKDRISNTAPITLGTASGTGVGGTIALSGTGPILEGTARSTTNNGGATTASPLATTAATSVVGLGALTLTSNSTLKYNGTVGTLVFSSFTDPSNSFKLNITGYTNTTSTNNTISGVDGTDDRLVFSQDQAANILAGDFTFSGSAANVSEVFLDTGFYEIVPVPEPATWAAGMLSLGVVGFYLRRKFNLAPGMAAV